jgi:hypothetical protein
MEAFPPDVESSKPRNGSRPRSNAWIVVVDTLFRSDDRLRIP